MTDNQDRIARKIRKLLAIAEDDAASAAEVQNAMGFARRLMDAHHVSEDDLAHEPADDYQRVDQAQFAERHAFVGRRIYCWESMLSGFVSKFVGAAGYIDDRVRPVRNHAGFVQRDDAGHVREGKSFVFYGVAEDGAIAAELYYELRQLIVSMAVIKWGGCYKGDGATYAEGFVAGLSTQLTRGKQVEQSSGTTTAMILLARRDDLVKYKRAKADEWLIQKHGAKLVAGPRRSGSSTGSRSAYSEGRSDGAATSVSAARNRKLN